MKYFVRYFVAHICTHTHTDSETYNTQELDKKTHPAELAGFNSLSKYMGAKKFMKI